MSSDGINTIILGFSVSGGTAAVHIGDMGSNPKFLIIF